MLPKEPLIISLRTPPATPAVVNPAPLQVPQRRISAWTLILLAGLGVLVGAAGWYFVPLNSAPVAKQNLGAVATTTNPANVATSTQATQISDIIARVGALIELPQNEAPTIATVTDPSKLSDQTFFANAKTGDIVLMYTAAREAYLYDPQENKLVAVAPITTSAATTTVPDNLKAAGK